ncbi:MAG: sigma-70 family RNA polymerase sigma factor [Acidobacteria bacterium]|nr:sigma-70 family RNA polymerase sigma factor [Acidobacteriota bacterium]
MTAVQQSKTQLREVQSHEVTQLLSAWSGGDQTALNELMPIVYKDLRRLAHHYMRRENHGHTLQTTALVNEAYLRLAKGKAVDWQDRTHFFAVCALVMRRILIDVAKRKHLQHVEFEEALSLAEERDGSLIALNDALEQLSQVDPRKAQVVELRYFGGLSVQETATVLKVGPDTVMRDWRLAKLYLQRELNNKSH